MIDQTHKLKALGYDFAIKGWADGRPTDQFFVMAWKPGSVAQTTRTVKSADPTAALEEILADIAARPDITAQITNKQEE